jgi:hypothetical protein
MPVSVAGSTCRFRPIFCQGWLALNLGLHHEACNSSWPSNCQSRILRIAPLALDAYSAEERTVAEDVCNVSQRELANVLEESETRFEQASWMARSDEEVS